MTPAFDAADWKRLTASPSWLSHAAVLAPPPAAGPAWTAFAAGRIGEAMDLAQAAFDAGGDASAAELIGLLCRVAGRSQLAGNFFSLAPPPDARAWRNRGVAALWGRDWAAAATAFAAGRGDRDADARWCRDALGLIATIARRWEIADALLGLPTVPPRDDDLGPIAHLCRMAAALGLNGPHADLGPDLRAAIAPSEAVAAPNAGSGRPDRAPDAALTVFLACDPVYLERFGLAALAAFAEAHPGRRLGAHLHLFDPTATACAAADRAAAALGLDLVLTTEATPPETEPHRRGAYYACARFCRLAEAMAVHRAPVVALDADAIVRRDLAPLLTRTVDVGLTFSPHSVPWNRYPAGFLLLRPTAAARAFAADVGRLIGDGLGRGRRLWFLDQWALLVAAARLPQARRRIRRFPWTWTYDTEFTDRGWVWQGNDSRKNENPVLCAEIARLLRRVDQPQGEFPR